MNRRQMLAGLTAGVPLLGQSETPAKPTNLLHHVSASAKVGAPLESLDLSAWAFHLTSDEYVKCAPEHHGPVQAVLPGGKRVFISVETIAGSFLSHHYVEDIAERSHERDFLKFPALGAFRVPDCHEGHVECAIGASVPAILPVELRDPGGDG